MSCKKNDDPIFDKAQCIYVFNISDVVYKTDGDTVNEFRIKRKYGKFKRPVFKCNK